LILPRAQEAIALVVSAIVVVAAYVWEHKLGLSLSDEGYLWYGVQRTLAGDVPLRDFMAYDPGRYYWSVPWMVLHGNAGIVGVRMAIAAFQWLGLWAGVRVVSRSLAVEGARRVLLVAAVAIVLWVWMVPRHKLFDISLSLVLIAALAWMVERPGVRRYALAGAIVGLVACFGRNHGLYGCVGGAGTLIWLSIRRGASPGIVRGACVFAAGFVCGMLPVWAMAVFVPGFSNALVDSVALLIEQGGTNLPLPVPWPWLFMPAPIEGPGSVSEWIGGWYFAGLLVFGVLATAWCFRERFAGREVPAGLVACAMMCIPYAHFAFSRADTGHLAQGVFPLLVGLCIIVARMPGAWRAASLAALMVTGAAATLSLHPGWAYRNAVNPVPLDVYGDVLRVDPTTAGVVRDLRDLVAAHASQGESFVVAPYYPGAYAVLGRKSPVWELYPLFPRTAAFQAAEIARLRADPPGFVLIQDDALDGKDLKFSRTHAIEFSYFNETFERSPRYGGSWYLFVPAH
jgi:hypothetical protein